MPSLVAQGRYRKASEPRAFARAMVNVFREYFLVHYGIRLPDGK